MAVLKIIQFKALSLEEIKQFRIRKAARAVVFDEEGKIGLLYVAKDKYHKLPGGGLEVDEDISTALKRECLEELGCDIIIGESLGEIIEYRDKWELAQTSYCYLANLQGQKGAPNFTTEEREKDFQIKWLFPDEALKIIEEDVPEGDEGPFIKQRDSEFLRIALSKI